MWSPAVLAFLCTDELATKLHSAIGEEDYSGLFLNLCASESGEEGVREDVPLTCCSIDKMISIMEYSDMLIPFQNRILKDMQEKVDTMKTIIEKADRMEHELHCTNAMMVKFLKLRLQVIEAAVPHALYLNELGQKNLQGALLRPLLC